MEERAIKRTPIKLNIEIPLIRDNCGVGSRSLKRLAYKKVKQMTRHSIELCIVCLIISQQTTNTVREFSYSIFKAKYEAMLPIALETIKLIDEPYDITPVEELDIMTDDDGYIDYLMDQARERSTMPEYTEY